MQTKLRARRSVLYVPAANAKAIEKAPQLPCDGVVFDLEDAVAPEAKPEARRRLVDHLSGAPRTMAETVIRINATSTEWGRADLESAARARPDAILIPKVETADALSEIRALLDAAGAGSVRLWAMIETPRAIVDLRDILRGAVERRLGLDCLVAGTNDLAKDTGLPLPEGRATIEHWLAGLVIHARAFGLDVLDGVFNDFRDPDGLLRECRSGALLGFDGKTLIHPGQIETANAVFSPSPEAVAKARAIVAAFDREENSRKGVISLNGQMVERLHADAARRLLGKVDG